MRRDSLRLFVLLLLIVPVMAHAADVNLPPPDPPGVWRHLTQDDATTTSRCIGNPVTPLCAIETYQACFLRRRPELCDMVEAGVRPVPGVTHLPDWREDYRIGYTRRPSDLDPVDRSTEGPMKPQPGDVVFGMLERTCLGRVGDDSHCETNLDQKPLHIYLLRRQGEFWTIPYRFIPRY